MEEAPRILVLYRIYLSLPFLIRKDFGESSEPNALPWDEIKSANFNKFTDIKKFIPQLEEKHLKRIATNKDFKYLIEDIETYNENKKKTFVSLKEDVRKLEKEKEEQKKI